MGRCQQRRAAQRRSKTPDGADHARAPGIGAQATARMDRIDRSGSGENQYRRDPDTGFERGATGRNTGGITQSAMDSQPLHPHLPVGRDAGANTTHQIR